jgi:hypothetical protein
MAKFNHHKPGFIAGQISPRAYGRSDLPQYLFACEELKNQIPTKEGATLSRGGSQYVKAAEDNEPTRIIPFIYSRTEAYAVEITTDAIRITSTSTRLTNPTVFITPYAYTQAELRELQYTQSADVLYIVHGNRQPYTIQRTAANTFSVVNFGLGPESNAQLVKRWPFRDPNITTTTITPSGTSGTVTLTASTAIFSPLHVGGWFKITHSGTTGAVQITGYTSPTVATASVKFGLAGTTATTDWEESAWSDYRGWPRSITFFEGRLVYGGNKSQPDTVWASKANNFAHLMARKFSQDSSADNSGLKYFGTTQASDPITATIAAQQVNAIQWLSGGKTLAAGTLAIEYVCPTLDATAANGFSAESTTGSSYIQAKRSAYTVLYVDSSGLSVAELQFDFEAQSYKSKDLSTFAEHPPLRHIDYQAREGILWGITTRDQLVGLTRDQNQQVTAWHFHTLGGAGSAPGVDPVVESLAVLPSKDGIHDDIWLCVGRKINSVWTYTIEIIGQGYTENLAASGDLLVDELKPEQSPFYVDCAIAIVGPGTPGTTFNVPHLPNEVVSVLADGFPVENLTVSALGVVTIPFAAYDIVVGLPYRQRIKPVRPEAGSVLGSAQGSTKRINRAVIRFHKTVGAKVGPSFTKLREINFRDASLPLSDPIPLFSGDKSVFFEGSYEPEGYVCLETTLPLPMNVLSITLRGETNES